MDTIKYKNHTINVENDETARSPRLEFENLGTMVCFHGRYKLGDEHDYKSDMFDGWLEMMEALIKDNNIAIILPIYMYDHSGITIKTTPFSCPWDSAQIGYIYISKEKIREEYGRKNMSAKLVKQITSYLVGEVETYDHYLTGNVYGYTVENEESEEIDSCWGFYGYDHEASGLVEEAKNCIDCI